MLRLAAQTGDKTCTALSSPPRWRPFPPSPTPKPAVPSPGRLASPLGFLGRPAFGSGRLRHGGGAHARGDRRRNVALYEVGWPVKSQLMGVAEALGIVDRGEEGGGDGAECRRPSAGAPRGDPGRLPSCARQCQYGPWLTFPFSAALTAGALVGQLMPPRQAGRPAGFIYIYAPGSGRLHHQD